MIMQDYGRRRTASTPLRDVILGLFAGCAILALILLARLTVQAASDIWRIVRSDQGLQVALILLGWGLLLAVIAVIVDLYQRGSRHRGHG